MSALGTLKITKNSIFQPQKTLHLRTYMLQSYVMINFLILQLLKVT